ncbi:hypothetical protein LEP1GSC041_3763 [Leptospira noguchii str. 2006001870]|uniref:Uncharacterized protein n=1 Tax=Leptospira noguchii serovar Autumnalis str. ZUN142 TaxID=1085540 RepID=M6UEK1_9LEPT|nr:hypothetical protein LEP1GSC041_3763 [Leptospira noguchii str. 2006001870]EMO42960.1 hypothetical protein LEP1GSC186_2322 [Leptospira noguchii serovar Autumnalis str. ZUN142]
MKIKNVQKFVNWMGTEGPICHSKLEFFDIVFGDFYSFR